MTERRQVRVTEQFFEQLNGLFPASPSPEGRPSATDFLLHEMPNVIEKLASDFEAATTPSGNEPGVRVLVAAGLLVPYFAVYAALADDGAAEIFYLDVD